VGHAIRARGHQRRARTHVAGPTDGRTASVTTRPCHAPPHPICDVSLIGGGPVPRPGEVSLVHHRIFLLDELPECTQQVLEILRQPFVDCRLWAALRF
jgi:magnesium chelatase family protein